jgi:hypothetical protein
MYYLIDEIINVNFIKKLEIFPLLTSALAAQRSVRNSVICTTALTYNKYTLTDMEASRLQYAVQMNVEVVDWNKAELETVDSFNSYFCSSWDEYLGTTRDVTKDGYPLYYNGSSNMDTEANKTLGNLFDHSVNTSWQPYTPSDSETLRKAGKQRTVTIDIEFPLLQLTWSPHPNHSTYWRIDHVEFSWEFNKSNSQGYDSAYGSVPYTFSTKQNGSDEFYGEQISSYKYFASDYTKTNDVQSVYLYNQQNETKWLRINFSSAEEWADAFKLNEITVYGRVAPHNIYCPYVIFSPVIFDASSSQYSPKFCPGVQPIFGVMYRRFVRSWLDDELWTGHLPFIIAIRAICLSPFYILAIGLGILICAYLAAFIFEWLLSSVDLFRENPYAAVPLVYSKHEYDKLRHEPQEFKEATIASDHHQPDLKEMMEEEEEQAMSIKTTELQAEPKKPDDRGEDFTNVELQPNVSKTQGTSETETETETESETEVVKPPPRASDSSKTSQTKHSGVVKPAPRASNLTKTKVVKPAPGVSDASKTKVVKPAPRVSDASKTKVAKPAPGTSDPSKTKVVKPAPRASDASKTSQTKHTGAD